MSCVRMGKEEKIDDWAHQAWRIDADEAVPKPFGQSPPPKA